MSESVSSPSASKVSGGAVSGVLSSDVLMSDVLMSDEMSGACSESAWASACTSCPLRTLDVPVPLHPGAVVETTRVVMATKYATLPMFTEME